MSGAPIQAVLFDWGGTLTPHYDIDFVQKWGAAARHLVGPELAEDLIAALIAAEADTWAQTLAGQRSSTTQQIIESACAALELTHDDAVRAQALSSYLEAWEEHTLPRAESLEVLAALRSRGLVTGLLSNTHWPSHAHEGWLERDGLLDLLDGRIYSCELTHMKPHRIAFEALLNKVGVAPESAVFVGDRHIDDIDGANDLGMRTVHINSWPAPPGRTSPDAVISELSELVAVVDGWMS